MSGYMNANGYISANTEILQEKPANQIDRDVSLLTLNMNTSNVLQTFLGNKDYSTCIPLAGAPRVGDRIAYKTLELSLSYTPEMSDFKEAQVISFDIVSNLAILLLSQMSVQKKAGDGDSFSRKFELPSDDEDGTVEETNLVEIDWKDVINPVLL